MYKLLPLLGLLVISAAPIKGACSAEERFKYAIANLTGQFLYHHSKYHSGKTYGTSVTPLLGILSNLYYYSNDKTKKQILSISGLDNDNELRSTLRNYLKRYNSRGDVKTRLDLKAFANSCDPFSDLYSEDLKNFLGGETENLDYSKPERTANIINECAKNQTASSKGKDIVSSDEIPNNSGIIYAMNHDMEVDFDHPFNPKIIKNIKFKVSDTEVVTIQALCGDGLLGYAVIDELDCQAVAINMKGINNTAVIFIPNKLGGLERLMYRLRDPDVFYGAMDKIKPRCISICIPLGEVNYVVDFKKDLEHVLSTKLNIFNPSKAEFCGITKYRHQAYVSSIMHQIHLIGTAGKAEKSKANMTSKPTPTVCPDDCDMMVVNPDRPFAYFVFDTQYGVSMLSGLFYKSTS